LIAEITDKKVDLKRARFFCGDKNADSITFVISGVYKGVSLVDVPVYIKTKNSLGECRKKTLEAICDGDKLLIEWKLGAEATAVCGRLICQLSFERADGTLVLNTQTFSVYIGDSIPDEAIADTLGLSHIAELQNKMQTLLVELCGILHGDVTEVPDNIEELDGGSYDDIVAAITIERL